MPNSFDKEKYVNHYENLRLYLRLGLKLKKIHQVLEFNQISIAMSRFQWLKQYVEFNIEKRIEAYKNGDKDRQAYGKAMEILRNRIDVKLVSNK